jgi:hypothetical protein
VFVFLAASASQAQVPAGAGLLSGTQRMKVQGCPKDSGPIDVLVVLNNDGSWGANAGSDGFSGTSTTRGRVTRLSFDAESLAELESGLEEIASELCEEPITISTLKITQALLKVSKRGDRAKLQLKVKGTGSGSSSGRGTYRATAVGDWQNPI